MKDNFKKTEEILFNYCTIKAEIKNMELEIEDLKESYSNIKTLKINKSIKINSINDSTFDVVIKKKENIKKMKREKNSKIRLLSKLENAIESLTDEEKKFIKYRYTQGKKTWDQVGSLMLINPNHCCNVLRPKIIKKISNLIFLED